MGLSLQVFTDDGFLVDHRAWTRELANQLAQLLGLELGSAHWEVLHFLRDYYIRFDHLPNTRQFVAAVRKSLKPELGQSRQLAKLFGESFLKNACRIAGLPKPPGCL